MTTIDPSSPLGVLRLRCGDWQDLPWLPDAVYLQTLEDCNNNLPEAAKTCATYILGMLSFRSHEKLAQMEIWSSESYHNYKDFLLLTVTNPAFMSVSPMPYSANAEFSPILEFQRSWNSAFSSTTESQNLSFIADNSGNDNSRLGNAGLSGWVKV